MFDKSEGNTRWFCSFCTGLVMSEVLDQTSLLSPWTQGLCLMGIFLPSEHNWTFICWAFKIRKIVPMKKKQNSLRLMGKKSKVGARRKASEIGEADFQTPGHLLNWWLQGWVEGWEQQDSFEEKSVLRAKCGRREGCCWHTGQRQWVHRSKTGVLNCSEVRKPHRHATTLPVATDPTEYVSTIEFEIKKSQTRRQTHLKESFQVNFNPWNYSGSYGSLPHTITFYIVKEASPFVEVSFLLLLLAVLETEPKTLCTPKSYHCDTSSPSLSHVDIQWHQVAKSELEGVVIIGTAAPRLTCSL